MYTNYLPLVVFLKVRMFIEYSAIGNVCDIQKKRPLCKGQIEVLVQNSDYVEIECFNCTTVLLKLSRLIKIRLLNQIVQK